MACSLGLDFGTSSVRALLLDLDSGREVAAADADYVHGTGGVIGAASDPDVARQHPLDWLQGLTVAVRAALRAAGPGFDPSSVIGIGTAGTGSTPVPVDRQGRALAEAPGLDHEPAALAWLWKDHTAHAEAAAIVGAVRSAQLPYLDPCGGTYSPEWFWAKVLHCARSAPAVFARAWSWVELCDFVPAWLCDARDPATLPRSVCAAGHKGMFGQDGFVGWPAAAFLGRLHPGLAELAGRLPPQACTADRRAGTLAPAIADQPGLVAGIPVAVGCLDAHAGAVGAGIGAGDLVKVIGTSSCDMAVARGDSAPASVAGIAGVVRGSILPGWIGYEAGQAAVGDLYAAAARLLSRSHDGLQRDAAGLAPGASGLLALDWQHGNRCVLMDQELSGLVLGLSLQTTPAELYRALLEATAFGARVIVDTLVAGGVPVRRIVACGGIAQKSPLLLQLHADVLDREIVVAGSTQASALGAAIFGAVAAGAFAAVGTAQVRLCPPLRAAYRPAARARAAYAELWPLYRTLHDAFGRGERLDLQSTMKRLLQLRSRCRA